MAKLIKVTPANITAANRTRVQKWLFSTGEMKKTVDEVEVPLADHTEVTAEHMAAYLEDNIKTNVRHFEKQNNMSDFNNGYADPSL